MALDSIHETVKTALEKAGWLISNEPLRLPVDEIVFMVDLGAERVIVAQNLTDEIAVEVKSFTQRSIIYTFYEAFGQYMFYRDAMRESGLEQDLLLAISEAVWNKIQKIPFLLRRIDQYELKFVVVDLTQKNIVQWIR